MIASKRTATSRKLPRTGLVVAITAGAALLASPAVAGFGLEDFGAADVSIGEQGILLYDYESGQQSTFDSKETWDQGTHTNTYVSPAGSLELAPFGDVGPRADIAWWDDAWASRQCVTVTNDGEPDSERPVRVTIDTATMVANGWLRADGADIRAVDTATGLELPHWIASAVPAESTSVWVQLDAIPAGDSTFCLYIGNPEAESVSDEFGVHTFTERTSRHYTLTDAYDGSETQSGQVRVVSYADGVVVSNGTITTTLNKGESDTFSGMTQHSFIDASGPISATGLGDNTDTLVPETFASTEFIFAMDRNVQQYWVRSPDAPSTIEVIYDNSVIATHTVTPAHESFPISINAEAGKSVVLRSTNEQSFVAAHDADGSDSVIGVPWTGQALYGLRSTRMQIGTGVAGATVTTAGSDGGGSNATAYGPNLSITIAARSGEQPATGVDDGSADGPGETSEPDTEPPAEPGEPDEPAGSGEPDEATDPDQPAGDEQTLPPEPATAAYVVTASDPVSVNQFDDGTGSESTTFLPLNYLDSEYLAPASFIDATFVCPQPETVVTMIELDGTSTSFDCVSAGTVAAPGIAATSAGEYPSGTRFVSANSFFLKIDKLGTADDTNVLGPRIARAAANTNLTLAMGPTEGTLPPAGSWTAVIDTEEAGVFGLITALGSQPDGTGVSIKLAGAASAELAASFIPVGPDGTAATSFEFGSAMIPYPMDLDRFVAIRVTLETDVDTGPSLSSLGLSHSLDLLDVDASATAHVSRPAVQIGSTGFVARVLTNPGTPMTASISYNAGTGLASSDRLNIRTDHPEIHVMIDEGVLTQTAGELFDMDAKSPFSILYDEDTTENATPSLTVRLQGTETDGFTRSNDIVLTIEG